MDTNYFALGKLSRGFNMPQSYRSLKAMGAAITWKVGFLGKAIKLR